MIILAILLGIVGTLADYRTSSKFLSTGVSEISKFNQDEYGYFSPFKYWRWHIPVLAAFIVPYILTGESLFGLGLIVIGGLRLFFAIKNDRLNKKSRAAQIAVLERLARVAEYDYDTVAPLVGTQAIDHKGGRGRIRDFGWWYVKVDPFDLRSDFVVYEKVLPLIWAEAHKPEWFTDTTIREVK